MKYIAILAVAVFIFAGGAWAQLAPASQLLLSSPAPGLAAAPSAGLAAAEPPQEVHGVLPSYFGQIYGGYTFFRFYALPNATENMNGFNFSVAFYPREWIAADGEVMAAFGSESGVSSQFAAGMGGVRLRLPTERELEFWVHGLVGGAHFVPQTIFGGENALAYEAGGGVDLNPHHGRFTYRLQGDVLETHFFGTYQASPKVSVGLVYKF